MKLMKRAILIAAFCFAGSCLSAGADVLYSPPMQGAAGDFFDCQVVNIKATSANIMIQIFDHDGTLVSTQSADLAGKHVLELAETFPGGAAKYYCKVTAPNAAGVRADAFMLDTATSRISALAPLK